MTALLHSWCNRINISIIIIGILSTISLSSAFNLHAKNTKIKVCSALYIRQLRFSRQNISPIFSRGGLQGPKLRFDPSSQLHMTSIDEDEVEVDVEADENNKVIMLMNEVVTLVGKRTNILVSLTFFITLAYRRDAFMISFFLGAVGNGILGKVLKKVINQERPEELASVEDIKVKPTDNGMPSSHAMSLGFICLFTALNLPQTSIPLALFALSSLTYRINKKLHTKDQIFVGLVLGVVNGFVWNGLTSGTFDPLPSINIAESISNNFLPPDGVLPIYQLWFPALIGAATVGSVERRIGLLIKKLKDGKDD